MLPGLEELLTNIPEHERTGWVVNPKAMEYDSYGSIESFRPCASDLRRLAVHCSNSMIARACCVTEAAVRKWMKRLDILGNRPGQDGQPLSESQIERLRSRAIRKPTERLRHGTERMTKERVSRIIGLIGKKADIVVQLEDPRTHLRIKYASAHDIR